MQRGKSTSRDTAAERAFPYVGPSRPPAAFRVWLLGQKHLEHPLNPARWSDQEEKIQTLAHKIITHPTQRVVCTKSSAQHAGGQTNPKQPFPSPAQGLCTDKEPAHHQGPKAASQHQALFSKNIPLVITHLNRFDSRFQTCWSDTWNLLYLYQLNKHNIQIALCITVFCLLRTAKNPQIWICKNMDTWKPRSNSKTVTMS